MISTKDTKPLLYCSICKEWTTNQENIETFYMAYCECDGCLHYVENGEEYGFCLRCNAQGDLYQEKDIGQEISCSETSDCPLYCDENEETQEGISHYQRTGERLRVGKYVGAFCFECQIFLSVREVDFENDTAQMTLEI